MLTTVYEIAGIVGATYYRLRTLFPTDPERDRDHAIGLRASSPSVIAAASQDWTVPGRWCDEHLELRRLGRLMVSVMAAS
jgi:hypothetical protein